MVSYTNTIPNKHGLKSQEPIVKELLTIWDSEVLQFAVV